MKSIRSYILLFSLIVAVTGCQDFFDPNYNNNLSEESVFDYKLNPEYVAGLYVPAYNAIPGSYDTFGGDFLDCATDNAVSNNYNSVSWKMRTISDYLTSGNYPIYTWNNNYRNIKSVYKFLSVGLNDDIVYRNSHPDRNTQIKKRMEGEAHFLLALNYFQLLRDYAGPVDGTIMGVPLVKDEIGVDEAKNISRSTMEECVDFIVAHIDSALMSDGLLPEYSDDYVNANPGLQVTIYGDNSTGLPTTTACYALKARTMLYAASPAYSKDMSSAKVTELYTEAAKAAKKVIDAVDLDPSYYNPDNIDDDFYTVVDFNDELILRRANQQKTWEQENFPPSQGLSVQGRTNPSQNLVDAFPMANGYPISDVTSGYDDQNPYAGRDPRFYMTITYNNALFQNTPIEMWPGGNNTIEGNGNISDDKRISRTNYYLRKWITEKPGFIPGVASETPWHFCAMFRAVEAYLTFAEAANMAVGAEVAIDGLTAKEAIRKVRHRANIPAGSDETIGSDPYLNGLTDITDFIKNERRIELCFEGHRFYDIRRWNDDMNTTVKKVTITTEDLGNTSNYDYTEAVYPTQVELPEYMRYGAIPRSEILVCPNLKQNDGWK